MLETGGDVRLTYNFVHSNSELRAPTTSCANSKILRVPSTKMLCRNFTILRLLGKPRPSCLSLGGGHEGAKGVGWNPASNSEGGEGFVVREVQGRRAPLNTKGVETSANITGYCQNPSRHGAMKQ